MNFSFKSLFAIWSLSPQRFHYYFFLSIVSWQYQKYLTILILVLCLLCVTPLVCLSCSSKKKLEDALEMLDLEWSKNDDTKTQCNRLHTSPLHRENASNKNGPARVKRRIQWEVPSKLLAVDDPLLLLEREVHAEIGINWFLDREIPKGGYVRILAESLLLEEHLGKTRIRTTEGLTTCMEPHRGWTIASSSWICFRKRWLDQEQELITVIQEETKRTEEKEEAGCRSPTWSILRALQKINKAKRLEGEIVMSAPPFF